VQLDRAGENMRRSNVENAGRTTALRHLEGRRIKLWPTDLYRAPWQKHAAVDAHSVGVARRQLSWSTSDSAGPARQIADIAVIAYCRTRRIDATTHNLERCGMEWTSPISIIIWQSVLIE